jgi:riboflavin kinase / FMN adenylyltransferase
MKLCHAATELGAMGRKICAAIGFFDGVHLGHQHILRQMAADARQHEGLGLAITFDAHPNTVVAPQRVPPLIYSLPQKLRAISAVGADALLLIHFDRPFSEQDGEPFIRQLVRDLGHLQSLCVGANFVFGHRRTGNVALLQRLGAELRFTVHGLAAVSLDGKTVSSTRIREAIRAGNLDQAGQMLGRAYSLAGRVVRGDGLGRQLGFPTANIDTSGLALPPNGVYAVHAETGGCSHRAVLNIGWRPTLRDPKPQLRVEAHLIDFKEDLYGEELEVVLVGRLRDEKRFPSLAELRQQIARDIQDAERHF